MESRRLYWERPYDTDFEGRMQRFVGEDGKPGVVLNRTLFHPEGGGQPWDTGSLSVLDSGLSVLLGTSDLPVSGVVERDGEIIHLVELGNPQAALSALPAAPDGGWAVRGRIDWSRRFDLMQQHTGQHILSRAFEEELNAETVGFHLSPEYASIDLDVAAVAQDDLARVEERANRVVFADVPVVVDEYSRGELPRDIRARFEIDAARVRIVRVGEFDACPCGGTHVSSSGQVGLIKVNQTDRAHGGVRVIFRCGTRALVDYRERQHILAETARVLSSPVQGIPSAAQALVDRMREVQGELDRAQEELLEMEIASAVDPHSLEGQDSVVVEMPGRTPDRLRYAAKRIAEASGRLTVCFSARPRFSIVVASLDPEGPDARSVIASIAADWGGKGGGTPQMAQLGSKDPLPVDPGTAAGDLARMCREMLRDPKTGS